LTVEVPLRRRAAPPRLNSPSSPPSSNPKQKQNPQIVSNSYASLDDGARSAVRGALLAWVQATGGGDGNGGNNNANPSGPSGPAASQQQQQPQQPSSPPPFIRNKLAQVLAAVAVREYLGGAWPSFFRDLARAAAASSPTTPHLADMLARVCASVDADFISLDIPRTQEEARLSMELKDAMRERGDAALLAEAWCACAAAYLDAGRADLSAALLQVAARYVHWVDIALVANDAYVHLLARVMRGGPGVAAVGAAAPGQQQQQPSPPVLLSPAPLRTAAALVLAEIVSKRMEPVSKIELVQRLDIVAAAAAWAAGLVEAASARQRRRQDRWRERQDRRQRRRRGDGSAAAAAAKGDAALKAGSSQPTDDAAPSADQGPARDADADLDASGGGGSSSSSGLDEDEDDDQNEDPEERRSLVLAYSRLLSALAGEVMDSLKRVENSVISMRALGLEVGDDALAEASGACAAAEHLLGQLAPAVLDAFRAAGGGGGDGGGVGEGGGNGSEEDARDAVALPLAPFVAAYLARLRALVKRGRTLPQGAREHLRAVLEGVAANARYPRGGANEGARGDAYGRLPAGDEVAALAAREEQAAVEERRRDLFVLLRAAAKLSLPDAVAFVAGLLQRAVAGEALAQAAAAAAAAADGGASGEGGAAAAASASSFQNTNNLPTPAPCFQDVEVAVTLLHELGEGAPEQALRPSAVAAAAAAGDPNAAPLGALVLSLLTNPHPLPHGRHRLVALAVAEATARYCRVLAAAPDPAAAALPALRALLGDSGVGHPSPDVCHRCAYLLARVVKQLRPALRPLVPDLLATLRPALAAVATTPPPLPPSQGGQQGQSSSSSAAAATSSSSSSTSPSSAAAAAALAALPYPYCVAAGGGGAGGPAAAAAASAAMLAADDRLYLFDAVGLLISPEEALPSAEAQGAALSSLLEPLLRQIEAHAPRVPREAAAAAAAVAAAAVAAAAGGGLGVQQEAARRAAAGQMSGGGAGGGAEGAGAGAADLAPAALQSPSSLWLVAQAMEAVSRLSKAFKNNLVTRSRPALGAMFARCLEASAALVPDAAGDGARAAHRAAAAETGAAVGSATTPPPPSGALSGAAAAASACAHLRSRLIALVHRMVELLLQAAAPTLPGALGALLRASAPAAAAAAAEASALPSPLPPSSASAASGAARAGPTTGAAAGAATTTAAADPRAAEEVCGLVAQLAQRFGAELDPLAQAVLPAVVERVHGALGPRWDWTGGRAARGGGAGGLGLASPSTSAAALLAAAAAGGGGGGPTNSGSGMLGTSAAAMASSPMAATSPLCRALAAGGASPLRRAALIHQAGSASARGAASAAAASAPSLLAALGAGGNNASASTEDEWRERASLQKAYFGLLHACATSGLAAALAALPPPALDAAVGALAAGAAGHVDPFVRRTCLQVSFVVFFSLVSSSSPPPHTSAGP
jgi:hypothetical protein